MGINFFSKFLSKHHPNCKKNIHTRLVINSQLTLTNLGVYQCLTCPLLHNYGHLRNQTMLAN